MDRDPSDRERVDNVGVDQEELPAMDDVDDAPGEGMQVDDV